MRRMLDTCRAWLRNRLAACAAVLTGVFVLVLVLISAPFGFSPVTLVIPEGATARTIAAQLAMAHVVRSPLVLEAAWRLRGETGRLRTGAYRFETRQDAFTVAARVARGDFGLPEARITVVEGATARAIAEKVAALLPEITAQDFLANALPYEGYLYPETYFFQTGASARDVAATMRATFDAETAPLAPEIAASGHSLRDIVTMASLLEREAGNTADRRMIAGILYNRLARGMPLQVDATFAYIQGVNAYRPTYADLATDSPYNTYLHKGLPPGPICNPGMDALLAALHPTKTTYLYYLTGKDGAMHYATTYAGHLANERKYLY